MICPKPYSAHQVVAAMIVMMNGVQILFPSRQERAVTGERTRWWWWRELTKRRHHCLPPCTMPRGWKDTTPNTRSLHKGWRWWFLPSTSWHVHQPIPCSDAFEGKGGCKAGLKLVLFIYSFLQHSRPLTNNPHFSSFLLVHFACCLPTTPCLSI